MKNWKKRMAAILSAGTLAMTGTVSALSGWSASADATFSYGDALKMSLYFYDANQCGPDAENNCLTWRGACHTYDGEASLSNAEGLSSASLAAIKAANGGSDTVDVSGGYHDAGDHLKFSVTMGFSTASLAWSYFENPKAYIETGCEDHLLYILKEMCDYMMKVTYLDSSDNVITFCYMVGDGGQDHGTWTAPEGQTMNRPTYWADASHPSADAAGEMAAALASTSLAFQSKNPEYAQKCLKYANALKDFAAKYPSASYDGIGSFYASGSQNDDVAWADLWCAIANNGGKLPDSYRPISVSQGVYEGNQYDYWVYSWDKVWGGYAALLYSQGRESYGNELVFEMDKLISNKTQYFPIGGWGGSRYNCAWQMYALTYAKYSGSSTYNEYAKSQMDTLLGANSANRTYLLGCGDTWPQHIHHRAANPNKDTMTYTLYGALVGGPDANGSYDDNTDSYSCTEPALDYNGCFALAAAGLYSVYGGSADKADATIASASEIKSDYVFDYGGSSVIPEPEDTWKIVPDTMTVGETAEAIIQHYIGGNDYIFTSSDPDVLEVSGSGLSATLTAKKAGTVTLTASCGAQILTHEITVVGETTTTTEETTTTTTESTTTTTEEITTTTEEVTTTTEESTTTTTSSSETTTESTTTESTTTETTTSTTNGGSVDPTLFYGDVNLDGDIDLADAVLLNKAVAGVVSLNELANKNADCNGNGTVTADDSMMLLQFLVHLINQLGPEA